MAYYTKAQAKQLLSGTAPENRSAVIKKLIAQGNQFEGLNAPSKTEAPNTSTAQVNSSGVTPSSQNNFKSPGSQFERPTLENLSRGIQETGAGALKGFSEGIGNTIKAGFEGIANYGDLTSGRIALPQAQRDQINEPLKATGDFFQRGGQFLGKNVMDVQKRVGLDTESGATQLGQGLGQLAAQVPGMMAGSNVTGEVGAALKGTKNLSPIIKTLIGNVTGGSVSTAGTVAAREGRLPDAGELATGAAIDTGATLIPYALKKLSKNAYEKLLGIPRDQAGKLATKGIDPAEALAERGYIAKSRKELSGKIGKDIGQMSDELDNLITKADNGNLDEEALATLDDTFKKGKFKADDLLDGAENYALNSDKLKPKFGEMSAVKKQIQKSVDEFMETVGDRTLTLTDIQALKKKLGGSLSGFFSKSGDAKATARELVNDAIRKNAKGIIETNVKGAAALNKSMSPLLEAQNLLKKKGDYSGTLGDLLIGSAVGGAGIQGGQSPDQILKNVLGALFIKKFGMSTLGRSLRGNIFGSLAKSAVNPLAKQAVKNLIPTH